MIRIKLMKVDKLYNYFNNYFYFNKIKHFKKIYIFSIIIK